MPDTGSARQALRTRLISGVGGSLLTALMATTRSEIIHGEEIEREFVGKSVPVLYVLWHGRLLTCAFRYRRYQLGTLISQNRDGDYITGAIEDWGFTVVRGSSSRGGSGALRSIVKLLGEGRQVAVTPDGPRGPRQKMKIGPLQAAQLAGVPVIPVTAGAVRGRFFGSWDRFLVPAPFTWTPVAMGDAVTVPRGAGLAELEQLAASIEQKLNEITTLVDEAARARRG